MPQFSLTYFATFFLFPTFENELGLSVCGNMKKCLPICPIIQGHCDVTFGRSFDGMKRHENDVMKMNERQFYCTIAILPYAILTCLILNCTMPCSLLVLAACLCFILFYVGQTYIFKDIEIYLSEALLTVKSVTQCSSKCTDLINNSLHHY